jgi:hypothetical protein
MNLKSAILRSMTASKAALALAGSVSRGSSGTSQTMQVPS